MSGTLQGALQYVSMRSMGKLWNWFKYSKSPQSKTRTKAKPNTPEVVEAVEVADESDYGTTSEESDYGTASAESDYGTTSAEYEAGKFDGYKGRANRFANRQFLEETAWKAASKAERKQQLRGGYTVSEHGLKV